MNDLPPVANTPTNIRDGLPIDMSKMAIWRKGLPSPITFLIEEEAGREVQAKFLGAVRGGLEGFTLTFDTYYDGTGRRSTSVMDTADIVGITLEYATLQLAR